MKKIIDFLKQYWFFTLLAASVAMLLALWVVQGSRREPSPLPIPSPSAGALPQPQSQFSQLLREGIYYTIFFSETDFAKIPQILSVYQTKQFTQEVITSRFAKIIVDLGFSVTPQEQPRPDGKYLVWQEKENYLQINIVSGQILFAGKSSLDSLAEEKILNSTQIQNLVKQKLVSWKLITDEAKVKEIKGFGIAGLELIPVDSLNQAVVFQIIYKADFEGYLLVGLGPARNHIEVKVNNHGVLNSLFFNLHQVEGKIVDNYPLKSYEETVNEIKSGKAQIIEVLDSKQKEHSIPSSEEIQEIRISSLSLAYYETTEAQEFYQPIFLLKGNIILKEGGTYQASFILPAISSEYLQPLKEHFKI